MGRFQKPKENAQSINKPTGIKPMKVSQVAHIVDKNSRTIAKICQLLEISQRHPNPQAIDIDGHISKKIGK
jgi:hypothetical protein